MTKRELVARLATDPITIEAICSLTYYRVGLHADPDPTHGVWVALAPVGETLIVDAYPRVHARIGGKTMRLTYRETERVIGRLRNLFRRGRLPEAKVVVRRTAPR